MIKTRCNNEYIKNWIEDLKKQGKILENKNYIIKKVKDWEESKESLTTFAFKNYLTGTTGKYAIWEI